MNAESRSKTASEPRSEHAPAILRNAFESDRTICIFEGGSGTLLGLATMVLVPLSVLALMPRVRPFRRSYVLLTYLLPQGEVQSSWQRDAGGHLHFRVEVPGGTSATVELPPGAYTAEGIGSLRQLNMIDAGVAYSVGSGRFQFDSQ